MRPAISVEPGIRRAQAARMALAGGAVPKVSAERSGIGGIGAFIIGRPGLRGWPQEFTP
jgi:hypothetical protein